jgi:hypothetical protein
VCGIYVSNEKKETLKICKTFVDLFNNGDEHVNNLLHGLHTKDGSGFRISSGKRKMIFRFCSRKLAPGSKRRIQNFAKQFLLQSE